MARVSPETAAFVRPQWSRWLKAVLVEAGIEPRDLGRALAQEHGVDEQSGAYTKLVTDWLSEAKTISARLAFTVGELLRDLGVKWCGGLVALWQAGYDAEVVERLTELARDDPPRAAAFIDLVVWLRADAEREPPAFRTALTDWQCNLGDRAAPLAKRKPPPEFRYALAIAQDGELSRSDRRTEAALILRAWASRTRLRLQLTAQFEMMVRAVAEHALSALEHAFTTQQLEMTLRKVAEHALPALGQAFTAQFEMMLPAPLETGVDPGTGTRHSKKGP